MPDRPVPTVGVALDSPVQTEEPSPLAEVDQNTGLPPAVQPVLGSTLKVVKARGTLVCGVHGKVPGFSNLESDGTMRGIDADFCRVVAAAIFGNSEAVEFRQLSLQERFTALQRGQVDVLFRNTTWTLSRDARMGLDFGPVIFYDGQAVMVRNDQHINALEDLEGGKVCVQGETTTEQNLTEQFRIRNISIEPLVFADIDAAYQAYEAGRCDAITSDRSQLIARRTLLRNPGRHLILDEVLSKEPLAPAVLQGDSQWHDVINWAVYATIQAEELGISSTNVETFMTSDEPAIRRLLGIEGQPGDELGLPDDFAVKIIQQVGNYGEIYDRNLAPGTPFDLPRGVNALWTRGGLLYAPPFR
ncbi:MAG: amino acid ABC transporter substrate-binding protein [Chloroflexaceae bacterium]|nr:amino acid ABC transporter substrate-binding protein [Chloroflexaceae bacterium]